MAISLTTQRPSEPSRDGSENCSMAETVSIPLRSVSQVNSFTKCPMAYKLERIDKKWPRPAAWLPQGSAFHTVAEHVELRQAAGDPMPLEEAKAMFSVEYSKEISRYTEETPNFNFWFWSGPYDGETDVKRRHDIGQEQVEKFYAWREAEGQELWVAPPIYDDRCVPFDPERGPEALIYDGEKSGIHVTDCKCEPAKPAIELAFVFDLDTRLGPIRVRGFIDAVVVGPDGKPRVRDYKTGNSPGDDFQLGVYALAVLIKYGVRIDCGDYYMAGKKGIKGRPTKPYDLREWTLEAVTEQFVEVEEGIIAGEFPPKPEADKCAFCSVNLSCPAFS